MSDGGRQVGAPSRWMVAPCPGKLWGGGGCKERAKRRQTVKYGGAIGVRSRGGKEIQKKFETGGAGGGYNKLL